MKVGETYIIIKSWRSKSISQSLPIGHRIHGSPNYWYGKGVDGKVWHWNDSHVHQGHLKLDPKESTVLKLLKQVDEL